MKLFTKDFLDNLQKKCTYRKYKYILDSLMNVDGLSFHDAVVLLAKWKGIEPEYFKNPEERKMEKLTEKLDSLLEIFNQIPCKEEKCKHSVLHVKIDAQFHWGNGPNDGKEKLEETK